MKAVITSTTQSYSVTENVGTSPGCILGCPLSSKPLESRFSGYRRLAFVVSFLMLGACSSMGPHGDDNKRVAPLVSSAGQTLPDGSIRHDTDSARVAQLWSASESAREKKDIDGAEKYLLEALKLKPLDPVLLSRAAELKLIKLEPALAENLAAKSIAYSPENRTLMHRNWLIIEHARELRGDLLGVRDAHKMVQNYQY